MRHSVADVLELLREIFDRRFPQMRRDNSRHHALPLAEHDEGRKTGALVVNCG
jgi:hypothetical protein